MKQQVMDKTNKSNLLEDEALTRWNTEKVKKKTFFLTFLRLFSRLSFFSPFSYSSNQ